MEWNGPERLKMFLWRILANGLLTNEGRFKRKLTLDPLCPRCLLKEESSLHALRDCREATAVWNLISNFQLHPNFFNFNIRDWIYHNLAGDPSGARYSQWPLLFAITIDSIWRQRNELVFSQTQKSTAEVGFLIKRYFDTSIAAVDLNRKTKIPGFISESQSIWWISPPEGWFKINCDGSVLSNNSQASCGGVLRNSFGEFVGGFAAKLGSCSITLAEIWAILHG
ncbi:Ribonuclease H-like superfamily [Sesbania bispinosa]|nr:Ribonuclease H-like superfamily [Sesbania bispinosa]